MAREDLGMDYPTQPAPTCTAQVLPTVDAERLNALAYYVVRSRIQQWTRTADTYD